VSKRKKIQNYLNNDDFEEEDDEKIPSTQILDTFA
jgi:hypothetical protein